MLRTGITFTIDGFVGELIKRRGQLLRRYDNGEYEYADDIDRMVVDSIENDDDSIDSVLSQIEDDTYRVYALA